MLQEQAMAAEAAQQQAAPRHQLYVPMPHQQWQQPPLTVPATPQFPTAAETKPAESGPLWQPMTASEIRKEKEQVDKATRPLTGAKGGGRTWGQDMREMRKYKDLSYENHHLREAVEKKMRKSKEKMKRYTAKWRKTRS
jgi:predicted lipid-binding transport protein (Tim44 family)